MPIAVVGDGHAHNVLHHEVRAPVFGGSSAEDLRDVRMVHECEGLALRLEPRHDLSRVHADLDHLERHLAAEGLRLLGQVDDPHSAFAKHAKNAVRADLSWQVDYAGGKWLCRPLVDQGGVPAAGCADPLR